MASIFLVAVSLFASRFEFTNDKRQKCHPRSHYLFLSLGIPGLAAITNLANGPSDDIFMVCALFSYQIFK